MQLESEHLVKIVLPKSAPASADSVFVVVKGPSSAVVKVVETELYHLLAKCMGGITTNLSFTTPKPNSATSTVHVFVDNSNVFRGAQKAGEPPVRVLFPKVKEFLESGRYDRRAACCIPGLDHC